MAPEPAFQDTHAVENENWTACKQCGARLLVDPQTGAAEPCAHCQSRAKKTPLLAGTALLAVAGMIVALLVALGISILL